MLIAVVMLGVLVLTVAAAWLLVQTRGAGIDRGANLLADVRERGLSAFWGEQPHEAWFLFTSADGEPLGWRRSLRIRVQDGYLGEDQAVLTNGTQWREGWQITDDALVGRYSSALESPNLPSGFLKVGIDLREDRVYVSSSAAGEPAASPAPANYVPEGLLDLALYLAGRQDGGVDLDTISNIAAVHAGRVRFVTIQVKASEEGVRVSGPDRIYRFDESGELQSLRHVDDESQWLRVSRDELAELFPEVLRFRSLEEALPAPEEEDKSMDKWEGMDDDVPALPPDPAPI